MLPMSRPGKMRGYVVGVILIVIALGSITGPFACTYLMKARSEEVRIPQTALSGAGDGLDLQIVTVLSKDAIPAILDPKFLDTRAANAQMAPNERVLGVSVKGESRAYPLKMLSRHEVVNDEVGGVPIAVTW